MLFHPFNCLSHTGQHEIQVCLAPAGKPHPGSHAPRLPNGEREAAQEIFIKSLPGTSMQVDHCQPAAGIPLAGSQGLPGAALNHPFRMQN